MSASGAVPPSARCGTRPRPGCYPRRRSTARSYEARAPPPVQVFLVAAITHGTGVVLGQRQVPDKRGEGAVVSELLAPLDVAGMVLTLERYSEPLTVHCDRIVVCHYG